MPNYIFFKNLPLEQKVERWERVVKVLKGLSTHQKRSHFKMRTFGEETPCGTYACAAGFAGMNRWFRNRGWSMRLTGKKGTPGARWKMSGDTRSFFGVEGSERIFLNTDQRGVGKVIKEIKEHIKKLKRGEVERQE